MTLHIPGAVPAPLYVNNAQKIFTYAGYYLNEPARATVRHIERFTHPMPQESPAYRKEVLERIKRVVLLILFIPLAAILVLPAFACYGLAACVGKGRFDLDEPEQQNFWQKRAVKVISLNACFQDPWAPLTGGVVPPLEPVANCASRVAAIVNSIAEEDPDLYMGQEFENLRAQDEFIRLMKAQGYRCFRKDMGSAEPIRNNSGLFIASKFRPTNVEFHPYQSQDRAGLAKWSAQGALTFTVRTEKGELRFVNSHLNYGEGPENQAARNRQLKNYVVPILNRGNAVAFGDLNCDTALIDRHALGLEGFENAIEGQVTCTDAGKHSLRGKSMTPNGRPCEDCAERIDAIIYNRQQVQLTDVRVKPLRAGNEYFADHSMVIATVELIGGNEYA